MNWLLLIRHTSSPAGVTDFHSCDHSFDIAVIRWPLLPVAFSCTNIWYALRGLLVVGGFRASARRSLIFDLSFASTRNRFWRSVKGFFFGAASFVLGLPTGFFFALDLGAAFLAVDFAAGFLAFTSFVAGSVPEVSLACRLTARLTGRDGSPTAFRGRPGVA